MKHVAFFFIIYASTSGSLILQDDIETSYLFSHDYEVYYDNIDLNQIEIYYDGSTSNVDINGGHIDTVESYGHSIINVHAGTTGYIRTRDVSGCNLYGGQGRVLFASGSGAINMFEGYYIYLTAIESSTINVYGYDLTITKLEESVLSPETSLPVDGYLTGFWSTGQAFNIEIGNCYGDVPVENPITFDHIVLHEIPEPATIFLLGLGFLTLKTRF